MAALSLDLPSHLAAPRRREGDDRSRCAVCGCPEVAIDWVEDPSRNVAFALELGECPRCEHRWTRPRDLSRGRKVQSAVRLHARRSPIPSAA